MSHQTSFHAYTIYLHSDCTEQALMSTQEDTYIKLLKYSVDNLFLSVLDHVPISTSSSISIDLSSNLSNLTPVVTDLSPNYFKVWCGFDKSDSLFTCS